MRLLWMVKKRRKMGYHGSVVCSFLKVRRWELEESQAPLRKNWCPLVLILFIHSTCRMPHLPRALTVQ